MRRRSPFEESRKHVCSQVADKHALEHQKLSRCLGANPGKIRHLHGEERTARYDARTQAQTEKDLLMGRPAATGTDTRRLINRSAGEAPGKRTQRTQCIPQGIQCIGRSILSKGNLDGNLCLWEPTAPAGARTTRIIMIQTGTALVIAPGGDVGTAEAATQNSPSQPIPGPPEWIELTEALGRAAATRVDGGT
jgi:hypothetical protein